MHKRIRKVLRRHAPRSMWRYLPALDHLALLRHDNARDLVLISPSHRVLYTVIPKAANSTIKRYLWAACGEVLPADAVYPRIHSERGPLPQASDYRSGELRHIFRDEKWFRFSFVRNPYSRLISAYKNRILGIGLRSDWDRMDYTRRLDPAANSPLSFGQFIKAVCSQPDHKMDRHWQPQTCQLMEGAISYSHIGQVERFRDDMRPVIDRLQLPDPLAAELAQAPINVTGRGDAPRFDAELAEMVCQRYRDDFERFGYDPDSWRAL